MPRVRLDIAEHDRHATREGSPDRALRLDTEVFALLGGGGRSTPLGKRPRIDRWLGCWSG